MRRLTRTLIWIGVLVTLCSPVLLARAQEPPGGVPTWVVEPARPAWPTAVPAEPENVVTGEVVPGVMPIVGATALVAPELAPNPDGQTLFSLRQLGLKEERLLGPSGGVQYVFTLPSYWKLSAGAELQLDLSGSIAGVNGALTPGQAQGLDGDLNVSLDGTQLVTVPLSGLMGDLTVIVPLPLDVFAPGNRHTITMWIDARYECLPEATWRTGLFVKDSSRLLLPHRLVNPFTYLRLLPAPIYEDTSFPEHAVVVVPDKASAEQLRAALVAAAGFGQKSSGDLSLSLVPESSLTSEMRDSYHLVFVGPRGAFRLLEGVAGLQTGGGQTGMLLMAVSPWNPARVVLLATGGNDDSVLSAVQAFAADSITVSERANVAVVPQTPSAPVEPGAFNVSLADLGYPAVVFTNAGSNMADMRFQLPYGRGVEEGGYFDLEFSHSVPVDWNGSGITVRLNGQPIQSVIFGSQAGERNVVRCPIPPSAARGGENVLSLLVFIGGLIPGRCPTNATPVPSSVSILPQSELYVPFAEVDRGRAAALDLANFPAPFAEGQVLMERAAFVVPGDDATAWNAACQVSSFMGSRSDAGPVGVNVAFVGSVPDSLLKERHVVALGQARQLVVLLKDLNDVIPALIDADNQQLAPQNDLEVDYFLPPSVDAGYLELMPSVWNHDRAVLLVSGNSTAGVNLATTALVTTRKGEALFGNLALASAHGVYSSRMTR